MTANLARCERKYSRSGYRVLAAGAGGLAKHLILAATTLGGAPAPSAASSTT